MPTYSTTRSAPTFADCASLDAAVERMAIEHAALAQMRSLGVVFAGLTEEGDLKLETSAPNVANKYGFREDKAPAPVVLVPEISITSPDEKLNRLSSYAADRTRPGLRGN